MSLQTYVRDNLNRIVLGTGGIGLIITGIAAVSNLSPAYRIENTSGVKTWECILDGSCTMSGTLLVGSGSRKNMLHNDGRVMFNSNTYRFPWTLPGSSGRVLATDTSGNLSWTTDDDNQNLFQTVAVSGQSNVVADSATDTLTLVAGSNVTITTDAGADSVTINASGGGGSVNTGALQNVFDNRYVQVQGDTMTGALEVQANLSGASLTVSQLRSCNTIDTNATGDLVCGTDDTGTDTLDDLSNNTIDDLSQTSLADPNADRIVFWDDSDTQLEWLVPNTGIEITGNNLNVTVTDTNANTLCSGTNTYLDGEGNCDALLILTQIDNDARYVRKAGDTMTGILIINPSSGTDALEVIGVASGRVIHAQDVLRSSGTLLVEGNTILEGNLTFKNDATVTLANSTTALNIDSNTFVINSATNKVGIGVSTPDTLFHVAGSYTGVTDALIPQMLFENQATSGYAGAILRVRTGGGYVSGNPELWLESRLNSGNPINQIRGVSNHAISFLTNDNEKMRLSANGGLSFGNSYVTTDAGAGNMIVSGRIGVQTTAPETPLDVLGIISGSALVVSGLNAANCDVKATNGVISCGTDATGAGGGMSFDEASSYFVNDTGDTMTGKLIIDLTSGTDGMEVMQIFSGAKVHVGGGMIELDSTTSTPASLYLYDFTNATRFRASATPTTTTVWVANATEEALIEMIANATESTFSMYDADTDQVINFDIDATPTVDFLDSAGLDSVLFLNLADGTERVGIGTRTPETKLEVVGTISGSALTVSNVYSCDTIDSTAAGVFQCGTDDDVPESGDFAAAVDLEADGSISANAVALTTDTTGNYAAGDAEAGNALTGDSATAFFSAGQIELARGGTNKDMTAAAGSICYSDADSLELTAAGSSGQFLISQGANPPIWKTMVKYYEYEIAPPSVQIEARSGALFPFRGSGTITGVYCYTPSGTASGSVLNIEHFDGRDVFSSPCSIDEREADNTTAATATVINGSNNRVGRFGKIRFEFPTVGQMAASGYYLILTVKRRLIFSLDDN